MLSIETRPVAKMMALGGVAVGSINASEEARVAGIIKRSGLSPVATAIPAKTGNNICVDATFEVSSVKKDIMVTIANTKTIEGINSPQASCPPNHNASPDFSKPSARANPPPNSKTIPQGKCLAVSQFIIFSLGSVFAGHTNNSNDMKMAVVPSLINAGDRKSVVLGKSVDIGGRRII